MALSWVTWILPKTLKVVSATSLAKYAALKALQWINVSTAWRYKI